MRSCILCSEKKKMLTAWVLKHKVAHKSLNKKYACMVVRFSFRESDSFAPTL